MRKSLQKRQINTENNHTILLLDDDESLLYSLSHTLKNREGYNVLTTSDPNEAIEIVRTSHVDLLITDFIMPGMNGKQVVEAIRKIPDDTVIVLLTGYADENPELQMIKTLDIHAYHEKGENIDKLLSVVIGALRYSDSLNKLKEMNDHLQDLVEERTRQLEEALSEANILNEKLKQMACRDGLTGSFNRGYFDEVLKKEIERSDKQHTFGQEIFKKINDFGLILLDIDHFKNYNDQNGHIEGDNLLKEMVRLLQKTSFESDIICRYGGEEFVIICPQTNSEGVRKVAEKIRSTIEEHIFNYQENQPSGNLTVSIGVSFYPDDLRESKFVDDKSKAIIKVADDRLYEAKQTGRNKVIFK